MKTTGTCPKCLCTSLWYVEYVANNDPNPGSQQKALQFQLAVTGKLGLDGTSGRLEAYACQQCGYVELYLKERLPVDGKHIRELRRPQGPPYRG
jgi:predicted nucleic-acid-binding Zn-ribbon protein